jgi:hypothetical protein
MRLLLALVGQAILPAAAFQAASWDRVRASGESRLKVGESRLKAGCSQDWLPHNLMSVAR